MHKLVIVESPTKAKTIRGFLPAGYRVEASMGHVRDLPSSASEVPKKVKGEEWARLGVNVENGFEPLYVVPRTKKDTVKTLKKLLKDADELLLATDEDREGESIGWHLLEELQPKVPVKRMVFHEITKEAIRKALESPREVNMNLVHAQEARRILDRLVGYTLSPLLWKKIAPKLSAGRVQSVAVRLLVLRERERRAFRKATYRDLKAFLSKRPDTPEFHFEAQLYSVGGKRLATGRDFEETTGELPPDKAQELLLLDPDQSLQLMDRLKVSPWTIAEKEEKTTSRTPYPPFTTATLQMEANRKLGLAASETMKVAQRLYERGYITYMRTDSVNLSDEAITAARRRIIDLYGTEYLNPKPRRYKTKAKGAQEAHEAIRPSGKEMLPADRLPLDGRERSLYDLIWKRSIATQMVPAQLRFTTLTVAAADALFRTSGRKVEFPGFFRAYVEGQDDPEAALEHQDMPLPDLEKGDEVDCRDLKAQDHETKPPARYTEATLVKALEAEGIGRPSTYATIINTIIGRRYVMRNRKELVPTFTAFSVTWMLEHHFNHLVDLSFTAGMEQKLDDIAAGDAQWIDFLDQFYLSDEGLASQVKEKEASVDPRTIVAVRLEEHGAEVRIGQFGPFLLWEQDGERVTTSLPPDIPPADLSSDMVTRLMSQKNNGPEKLADDPETGLPIFLKVGPYGPYVQLGEDVKNGKKPKRISLLKGMDIEEVDEALALKLLSLPRNLGKHPETNKVVKASVGRFGPYLLHDKKYTSIKEHARVLDIELEEAVALIAAAPAKRQTNKKVLKDLGTHPDDNKLVRVMDGRYGPYVNHGRVNATLPKDQEPTDVTMGLALELLAAKKKSKKKPKKKKKKTKSK